MVEREWMGDPHLPPVAADFAFAATGGYSRDCDYPLQGHCLPAGSLRKCFSSSGNDCPPSPGIGRAPSSDPHLAMRPVLFC